jgi:ubiquinone/menaquinone biosynthesis C-methylase UbiE
MEKAYMSEAIKRAYDAPGGPESYAKNTRLFQAEEFILAHLYDEIKDKAILDIGVGSGRTLPYFRALSKDYTGIDYSENMLKYCKAKYSDTRLLLCDARNMDSFKDRAFDVVFSCWNVLDDGNHEDRNRILKEVHRVLRRNGLFIFSSHNLDFKRRSAYRFRGLVAAATPLELMRQNALRIKRYFTGIRNHLRVRRNEVHEEGFSIINDPSHSFSLLTYYIKKEHQVKQLEALGFSKIEMVDGRGSLITVDEVCRDGWIYYICRKAG